MSRTTHVIYLLIVWTLWFNWQGAKDKTEIYAKKSKANYKLYVETMNEWSTCLAEQAGDIHEKTVCNNSLYDLRDWLRKCKCKCTGFGEK